LGTGVAARNYGLRLSGLDQHGSDHYGRILFLSQCQGRVFIHFNHLAGMVDAYTSSCPTAPPQFFLQHLPVTHQYQFDVAQQVGSLNASLYNLLRGIVAAHSVNCNPHPDPP